jgi:hypothetical protein
MITAAIIKSLQVYGLAIVISLLVAVIIKALVSVTARLEKVKPVEIPTGKVCPIGPGISDEDVAALSAAIFAAIGPHRILRIGQSSHSWASGTRAAQHSHTRAPASGRGTR